MVTTATTTIRRDGGYVGGDRYWSLQVDWAPTRCGMVWHGWMDGCQSYLRSAELSSYPASTPFIPLAFCRAFIKANIIRHGVYPDLIRLCRSVPLVMPKANSPQGIDGCCLFKGRNPPRWSFLPMPDDRWCRLEIGQTGAHAHIHHYYIGILGGRIGRYLYWLSRRGEWNDPERSLQHYRPCTIPELCFLPVTEAVYGVLCVWRSRWKMVLTRPRVCI